MSLDVYLHLRGLAKPRTPALWIREEGQQRTITREEWEHRFPGREPVVLAPEGTTDVVYHANITHNLGPMAHAAGLYAALWRPEEAGWSQARDLIGPLQAGIEALETNPDTFTPYVPTNGWGTYGVLLAFSKRYLTACQQWPEATVEVSR